LYVAVHVLVVVKHMAIATMDGQGCISQDYSPG